MKRYFLYCMLSCCLYFSLKAQGTSQLQVVNAYFTSDSMGQNIITNLTQNQWVYYNVAIANVSTVQGTAFTGTLALACQINPNNTFSLYLSPPGQTVTIAYQDTALFIFGDTVNFNRYGGGGGGGTVVIWPITTNSLFTAKDSFLLPFVYVSVESIMSSKASLWNIYPNPAQNVLHIENNESKNNIEHVRIFNTTGVLLREKKEDCTEIEIADLPQGVYFLSIKDKSGKVGAYKIIVAK